MTYLPETPSQTAGPYVHIGLIPNQAGFDIFQNNFGGDIAGPDVAGERIVIEGRIFDASGHIAKDVLVETFQRAVERLDTYQDRGGSIAERCFRKRRLAYSPARCRPPSLAQCRLSGSRNGRRIGLGARRTAQLRRRSDQGADEH